MADEMGSNCEKAKSPFDLSGKVAIVTGAGGGIGEEIAKALGAAGCSVVVSGRRLDPCQRVAEELGHAGVQAQALQCDVRQSDEVEQLVARTLEMTGKIDILVNNAAVIGKERPLARISEHEWDDVISTNLKGAFLCSRAVAPWMIESGGGKIINIASIAGLRGLPFVIPYCASKGGLISMTQAMALEFAEHNIQVNAICPGHFETPMSEGLYGKETWKKIVAAKVPMKRMGLPEELRTTVVYLASGATSFMTGESIVVDGGQLAGA